MIVYIYAEYMYIFSMNVNDQEATSKSLSPLDVLLETHSGLILVKDALEVGVSRQALSQRAKRGGLERIAQGVYLSPTALDDAMYRIQSRCPKAVYSHGTALFLHDLTDRTPDFYTITVPNNYNASSLRARDNVQVFYTNSDFLELGTLYASTPQGRKIRIYNLERTICDISRSRNRMDIRMLTDAWRRYVRRPDKDLVRLMEYARLFRIEKIVRTYLEVLL